jgi:hypothetical protein
MTNLEELLSRVGASDFWGRVHVKKSSGMSEEYATELVAQEMISETHAISKATAETLLIMLGQNMERMSEAEATLAQR